MQKTYDKNNNDTYTDIFSYNPAKDVEIHMFRSEKGSVVTDAINSNNLIKGNFTVESAKKAANSVLQFISTAEARDLGLIPIKKLTVPSLYPLSLIERYNISLDSLKYQQIVPVFFDTKIEKFLILMDRRFLRDVNINELNLHGKKNIKTYVNNKNGHQHFVGVIFEDFQERKLDLSALENIYHDYLLTLKQGKKVIVIRSANDTNRSKLFSINDPNISSLNFSFEFSIAYQFGDYYYFTDDNGNINSSTRFNINKKKIQSKENLENESSILKLYNSISDDSNVYIVDYSDEQYNILLKLRDRINAINNEIVKLFGNGDPECKTDPQILSLDNHQHLKLISQ